MKLFKKNIFDWRETSYWLIAYWKYEWISISRYYVIHIRIRRYSWSTNDHRVSNLIPTCRSVPGQDTKHQVVPKTRASAFLMAGPKPSYMWRVASERPSIQHEKLMTIKLECHKNDWNDHMSTLGLSWVCFIFLRKHTVLLIHSSASHFPSHLDHVNSRAKIWPSYTTVA